MGGLITISVTEETWIEMSSLIASQFLGRLQGALAEADKKIIKES